MAIRSTGESTDVVDLGALIDTRPISPFQVLILVCCAVFAFFDGLDTQSIGVAGPFIARAFHLRPGALGPVFSAGQVGSMVGALVAGLIGDRIGRKPTLLVAVLLMGAGTLATAFSNNIPALLITRLISGLGLGAATPCFVALSAEFAPARVRGFAVAAVWAAFPFGGFSGGLINPRLAEAFGWQSIFYFGGVGPLIFGLAAVLFLPESLRYLAATGVKADRMYGIVRKIAPEIPRDSTFVYVEPQSAPPGAFFALLQGGRAVRTLLLWVVFIITFSALLFQPLWAPSLLTGRGGLTLRQASLVVAMSNLGSVIGTASVGRLIDKLGATGVLAFAYIVGAIAYVAVALPSVGPHGAAAAAFISCMCVGGASAGALTLAASCYPTVLRSTGVGAAMSMARLGQIVNALVIGALVARGWTSLGIFEVMSIAVLLASIAIFGLSRTTDARQSLA